MAKTSGKHQSALANDDFIKHDNLKSRVDLLVPQFILEMGHVMGYGAKKYDDENWRKCPDHRRYLAAAMRHLLAALDDDRIDESGLPHLAHAACSLMMAYELCT